MRKKKVFISYSVKDKKAVERIRRDLETAELDVWIYPDSILPADHIVQSEAQGILECDKVLLMWSQASVKSKAVQKEIQLTQREENKSGKKKLVYCRIEKDAPIPHNEIHQVCDLYPSARYTSEILRLLKIIQQTQDFWLEPTVSYWGEQAGRSWFKIVLQVHGIHLNEIIDVDYQLHSDIATSGDTDWRYINDRNKNYQITFYSYDPEIVYCLIRRSDGSYEEIRKLISLKLTQ